MRNLFAGLQNYRHLSIPGCLLLAALAVPSQAVVYQAENYNNFYDTTPGNTGGAFRNDGVDIEATSDASGGGYNVGWIEATEWLVYNNLSIPTSGNYTIRMRVASPSGATASVDLNGGTIQLGDFAIPATGDWQNWTTVSRTVNINAGTYNLGVFAKTNGWNFNWIEVVSAGGGGTTGLVTVYEHCDFAGWSAGFNVGSYDSNVMASLGAPDNKVSSIRVAAGYEAVLYDNWDYSGASVVVSGNNSCLSNFNDRTSSIVVRPIANNGGGFASVVSESQFNTLFPGRNSFYNYAGLAAAAQSFPAFAGTGDLAAKKREAAAALANFSHETGRFVYVTEIAKGEYCGDWDNNPSTCPCAPGKRYYGRGPIQLSWNGNYCAAGAVLGLDLRANPDLVEQNPTVAWQTSLWFWMTQAGPGPRPAHASMTGGFGFGDTIRAINGTIECNGGNPAQVQSRISEYQRILNVLGATAGPGNLGC